LEEGKLSTQPLADMLGFWTVVNEKWMKPLLPVKIVRGDGQPKARDVMPKERRISKNAELPANSWLKGLQ